MKTKIHEVNEHKIAIPAGCGFKVRRGGMFDAIEYKGFEICTFEMGELDDAGNYTGPFNACDQSGREFEAATLDAVAALIDKSVS